MYELIKASDKAYYIECPSKIGLVKIGESEAVLIDSGSDRDAGKKALRHLEAERLKLTAIYNTHSHADHIGGNNIIFQRTGCSIYAKGLEADFTRHTVLEPAFLYGANPPSELRHKFLLAAESPAEELTQQRLADGWELLDLCGHTFDMVGFKTEEGIAYIADALSSEQTLDKYGIGYIYDVEAYLSTLERLKRMEARLFIPSHAVPVENIVPLADYNILKVCDIAEKILSLTVGGISLESLVARLFREYAMTVNFTQHALVTSTVKSYLTYLREKNALTLDFKDETMIFVKN